MLTGEITGLGTTRLLEINAQRKFQCTFYQAAQVSYLARRRKRLRESTPFLSRLPTGFQNYMPIG